MKRQVKTSAALIYRDCTRFLEMGPAVKSVEVKLIITDKTMLHETCVPASKTEADEIILLLEKELLDNKKIGVEGIGLAAPQIGINKQVAIIRIGVVLFDLVNCSISNKYDKIITEEGCLSLPNKYYRVERFNQIIIQDNRLGNIPMFSCYGLPAVAVQHEMDHWDGVLIEDKAIIEHNPIGHNMSCPCGSGKKYKKCCKRK
jgi:peptide deformylase